MTESTNQNPLTKYFRQPIFYIKLPSGGKWYEDNSLEMTVTGELPVYTMTGRDEITIKTPDSLMSGEATVSVIQSCIPAIKNAWKMPLIDLDALLIAIRIATFGNQLDFATKCSHCKFENEHGVDLSVLLGKIRCPDWDTPTEVNGLKIFLKPQTYEYYNQKGFDSYSEQRALQSTANNEETSEIDKIVQFHRMYQKIIDASLSQVAKSIRHIQIDDGTVVSNPDYITEFMTNCDRTIWDALKARLETIRDQSKIEITTTCQNPDCGKTIITPFTFEYSSFFA